LDRHKREFAGVDWMPANLFQRKRVIQLLERVQGLYDEIEAVDFTGLPGEAQLIKARYRMWLDLRLANRWQVKDHMKFLKYLSSVLDGGRNILSRLRRLALSGEIVRSEPGSDAGAPRYLLD
jgi:hypothetical protein